MKLLLYLLHWQMFGPMHVPLFWHVVEHIANGEKKSSLIGENNCELG
jgi:hypothetical protein